MSAHVKKNIRKYLKERFPNAQVRVKDIPPPSSAVSARLASRLSLSHKILKTMRATSISGRDSARADMVQGVFEARVREKVKTDQGSRDRIIMYTCDSEGNVIGRAMLH